MKASEIKCDKCGQNMFDASKRGAYLARVNQKGELPMIMECRPSCDRTHGNQDDALLGAIKGN